MSEELKKARRRPARRNTMSDMDEGSSPEPTGYTSSAACGHGSCGTTCNVRYVGMTSHVRDHHVLHAARGVSHIWSAAIVTGLAIVLTGAIAFSAVEARSARTGGSSQTTMAQLMNRLDQMERGMRDMRELCSQADVDRAVQQRETPPTTRPSSGSSGTR